MDKRHLGYIWLRAFTVPEMNWLGVHLFRECFERILTSWIKHDYMDKETAYAIAEMVMHKNAELLYQIKI